MDAQDLAGVDHRAGGQGEAVLERVYDLGPAGVADEAADVGSGQPVPDQERLGDGLEIVLDQAGDIATEYDLQSVVGHVPSHDVEAVRPSVLMRRADDRSDRVIATRDDGRRSSVAEQGGGDQVGFGTVLITESQGAQFDHKQQHPAVRRGAGHVSGAGQAHNAAGAPQAEDRQAAHIGPEWHDLHQPRFQRRRGDAGGADRDDGVDLIGRQTGLVQGLLSRLCHQRQRMLQEQVVAFGKAVRLQIPVDRHAGMPRLDQGVAIDRRQPLKAAMRRGEHLRAVGRHLLLTQEVRRPGRGETRETRFK